MPSARRVSPSVARASNEFMISPGDSETGNDDDSSGVTSAFVVKLDIHSDQLSQTAVSFVC